jgi:hypothetical protein
LKPTFFFLTPAVAVFLLASAVVADPVKDLQCLEAEWSESIAELQENRAMVWQWMHSLINRPDQVDCSDKDFVSKKPDWLTQPEYSWTCLNGQSDLTTTLSFRLPDEEQRNAARDGLAVLGKIDRISNPHVTGALQTAIEDVAQKFEETLVELEAAGVAHRPKNSAFAEAPSEEALSISDLLVNALPLQNRWGLTADLAWTPASPEIPESRNDLARSQFLTDLRTRIGNLRHIDYILKSFEETHLGPGIAMQNASAAYASAVAVTEQKAEVWASENLGIAARSFRLFGEKVDLLQRDKDSISVTVIRSWSKSPGTDWDSTTDAQCAEGVNELVFYFQPQPVFERQNSGNGDCRITKSFPCPPFKKSNTIQNFLSDDWNEGCGNAEGCRITSLRWINDHMAIRTRLRAKNADAAYLSRFAARMLTFRTKTLLTASEPDPEFDPALVCK